MKSPSMMDDSAPIKEQLMLINALAISHQEYMKKLTEASETAQRFTDALEALGKCPEFYTLLFSVHDTEIPLETRTTLASHLQQSLYGNQLQNFTTLLYTHLSQARDDYETGYYLIILESITEFMQTSHYLEFSHAKQAFDDDHCDANEQLKSSIASLKQQVRELMYPTHNGFNH